MKTGKIFACILAIMMIMASFNPAVIKAETLSTGNEMKDTAINVTHLEKNMEEAAAVASEANVVTHHTPDTALFLNADYIGKVLMDSTNSQYSPTAAYTFQMNEVHSVNSKFYTTKSGHQVEITNTAVYVDGAQVNLNWNFVYNINYIRTQEFEITSATAVDANSYQNGTFIDGQNMNASSDCFRVKINNFNMSYYCNNPYDSWTKNFGANAWTYFYIDAATGKTIGTDANYYHTNMGIKNRFNKF